jgi:signal transduction histidine kinase
MNGILGFSRLLQKKGIPTDKQSYYVSIINENADRLLRIINDIIDISKLEAGQFSLQYKEVDLNPLVNGIVDQLNLEKDKLGKKSIRILVEHGFPDKGCTVITDSYRLGQVLINLVNNAIKFTFQGHVKISYRLTDDAKWILFSVKDTGIGIRSSDFELIFERFRQVDSSTTRVYEGAGLGLSITKGIIDLFGGDIWLRSEEGKGSEFFFTVPYLT